MKTKIIIFFTLLEFFQHSAEAGHPAYAFYYLKSEACKIAEIDIKRELDKWTPGSLRSAIKTGQSKSEALKEKFTGDKKKVVEDLLNDISNAIQNGEKELQKLKINYPNINLPDVATKEERQHVNDLAEKYSKICKSKQNDARKIMGLPAN